MLWKVLVKDVGQQYFLCVAETEFSYHKADPKPTWQIRCSLDTLHFKGEKNQKKPSPNLFLGGKVGHTLISDLKAQWKTNGAMPSQSMRNSGILMMFASDLTHWRIRVFSPPRGQGWGFLTSAGSVAPINFILLNWENQLKLLQSCRSLRIQSTSAISGDWMEIDTVPVLKLESVREVQTADWTWIPRKF